jgi:serine/threonine protein phosphatase 1
MPSPIAQFLGRARPPRRRRVALTDKYEGIYAIGDIHGRLDLLLAMEQAIVADASRFSGPKLLVMLGDYVDRGPSSRQVIEHLMKAPPAGIERICLAGNHEEVMADFVRAPSADHEWLVSGGIETLFSYGINPHELELAFATPGKLKPVVTRAIPKAHLDFINGLPALLTLPRYTFEHAGIRPGTPMDEQRDEDLLWIRYDFLDCTDDYGSLVVHGHTPGAAATIAANRIGLDTGAFATGLLSAVALSLDAPPRIIEARLKKP